MSRSNPFNVIPFQDYSRQKRVRENAEESYPEEILSENADRIAAMERRYFSAFFRRKVGITFADWLRQIQIAEAMELLKKPDQSMHEIAGKAGFSSLGSFQSAFRWHTKTTPEEFRKAISARSEP